MKTNNMNADISQTNDSELIKKRKIARKQHHNDEELLQNGRLKNVDVIRICAFLIVMCALVVVDLAVFQSMFLDLNLTHFAALSLTFLLSIGLQLLPAMSSVYLAAITSRWAEFKKAPKVGFLITSLIVLCIIGTIGALIIVTYTRMTLYQYGGVYYGEQIQILPIVGPFLTSITAFVCSYVLFPSKRLIDSLVENSVPKPTREKEEKKRQIREKIAILENADIPHYQFSKNQIESKLASQRSDLFLLCQQTLLASGVLHNTTKASTNTVEEITNLCNNATLTSQLLDKNSEAYRKTIEFLTESVGVLAHHFRSIGYPDFFQADIQKIDPAQIIDEYIKNHSKGGRKNEK